MAFKTVKKNFALLSDLVKISKGKKYNEVPTGKHRYITIEDLHRGNYSKYTDDKGVICNANDILIAWDGANAGKVGTGLSGVIGSTLAKLVLTDKRIESPYLYWFLEAKSEEIKAQRTGATIPHVNGTVLKKMEIPLISLGGQIKIAEILNKADTLRKKDKQLLQYYDELSENIFSGIFGDPIRNEKGWSTNKLGDHVEKIQIGPFGTQLHVEDYVIDGIPLINPMHIVKGKICEQSKFSITEEKYKDLKNYHLKIGDIIMGRRGEMGRCALVGKREDGWLCGTGSLYIRPGKGFNPLFLANVLSSNSVKGYLERSAQGVTMANLNKSIVYNIPAIYPPVTLQNQFAQQIQNIEQQKEKVKAQIQESENLFQALLQKAFNGGLN